MTHPRTSPLADGLVRYREGRRALTSDAEAPLRVEKVVDEETLIAVKTLADQHRRELGFHSRESYLGSSRKRRIVCRDTREASSRFHPISPPSRFMRHSLRNCSRYAASTARRRTGSRKRVDRRLPESRFAPYSPATSRRVARQRLLRIVRLCPYVPKPQRQRSAVARVGVCCVASASDHVRRCADGLHQ